MKPECSPLIMGTASGLFEELLAVPLGGSKFGKHWVKVGSQRMAWTLWKVTSQHEQQLAACRNGPVSP